MVMSLLTLLLLRLQYLYFRFSCLTLGKTITPPPLFVLGTSYIPSLRAKTKNKQYILSRLLVYYVKTFTSNL